MIMYHRKFCSESWGAPVKSPATELNGESDGELGELEHVRETELVRDIDAATEEMHQYGRGAAVGGRRWPTRWRCGYNGSSCRMRSRW